MKAVSDTRRNGIRAVAAALGLCVGISGIDHGFFEVLQGNTPTPGLLIPAIGPDHLMWVHGTEDAFTIVPNYLVTGILAMALGLATIVWSLRFIDRPDGARNLLLLGGALFLVGGGVGMIVFLLLGWAAARRIDRPPRRHRTITPAGVIRALNRAVPALIAAGLMMYGFAVAVAVTGFVPGVADPDRVQLVCWGALFAALAGHGLALAGASAGLTDTAPVEAAH